MKDIGDKIEKIFMDIAVAEEQEIRHAGNSSISPTDRLDNIFEAISFAEVGEFGTTQIIMDRRTGRGGRPVGHSVSGFCAGSA